MNEPNNANATPASGELSAELGTWCKAWQTSLESVLAQVSGKPSATFELTSESFAATDSNLWYTVTAGGAVHGEMALRVPVASGTRLALKFLGEPEPPAERKDEEGAASIPAEGISPEHKEALDELLRQITGLTATALGSMAGGEVKLNISASSAPSWSSNSVVCLRTRDEAGASISFEVRLSPALAREVTARLQLAHIATETPSAVAPASATVAKDYRRLMNVGLDVKLRFGTRRMILRDILALSAGMVVELDNALHSPVELLLEGRLIAQGEVVVVDGKYGLRITDVTETPLVG